MFSRICSFLIFVLSITLLMGCQASPERYPIEKDGKTYGTTDGIFKGRWWHFYERGLSFADGEFWEKSEMDLRDAIQQRKGDHRQVRTYGRHFIDYFPHRELGVALFHQEKFGDAIKQLELSLRHEASAKARVYIDRARKAWIEKNDLDHLPPEIIITSPEQNLLTNAHAMMICGTVRDDTFVHAITIGEQKFRTDVSAKEIPFHMEIPIHLGENKIRVQATDLLGKKSDAFVTVKVERTAPIIAIDEPFEGDPIPHEGEVALKGYAFDDSGLEELIVNGQRYSCDGKPDYPIQINVVLQPRENRLYLEVKDLAGNVTSAKINLAEHKDKTGNSNLLAENGIAVFTQIVLSENAKKRPTGKNSNDATAPIITLTHPKDGQLVYSDKTYFEGNIKDREGVELLFIDGKKVTLRRPGKMVFFKEPVSLTEGENNFTIRAADFSGHTAIKKIRLIRKNIDKLNIGSRLKIAVVDPFERAESENVGKQATGNIESLFFSNVFKNRRFSVLEWQKKNSKSNDVVDEETALEIGKKLGADCLLFGRVTEREGSVEILIKIKDTETGELLAVEELYSEATDYYVLKGVVGELVSNLVNNLPIVSGTVLEKEALEIILDIGQEKGIREGMKLTIFQFGDALSDPKTEKLIGQDYEELGQARVYLVENNISRAILDNNGKTDRIQRGHRVITK